MARPVIDGNRSSSANGVGGRQTKLLALAWASTLCLGAAFPLAASAQAGDVGVPNPRAVSLYNLGLTAYKQGSPESAIIFFKRACDIDPNLADAQYNLAVIFQAQKRMKDALPRFEEVLRIKPTDPDAHFQMGVILQDMGRYPEAKQHFGTIAPNNNHFQEAQRRTNTIDGIMSGQIPAPNMAATPAANPATNGAAYNAYQPSGSAQPAYVPQGNPFLPKGQPEAELASDPGAAGQAATQAYNPAGSANQIASSQTGSGQPYMPAGSTPAYAGAATSTGDPAVQPAPSAPPAVPVATTPVPVMANISLKVVATGFNAPSGLAFDRAGNLYVANYMTNSIDRIAPDGTRNAFASGVNLRGPIGLIVDEQGQLYVANYNSGTVAKINPAGVATVIASGFRKPYYLALDSDGNLYVTQQEDNSIVRISLPRVGAARPQ